MSTDLVPAAQGSYLPAPAEWQTIERMAQVLAGSALVPAAYRGKPQNVILATLAGRPFGWDPTMSMRSFHIIEGTPSLKPEILLALVRRAGHSVTGETSPTGATVTGTRCDTGDKMTVSYTMEDARRANLAGKAVWKQYPQSMCWARALSQLCRMLFPDVVLGCGYTPEELGDDFVGEDPVGHVPGVAVTVAAAKSALVAVFVEAGFEDGEAKTYAADAWARHEMGAEASYPRERVMELLAAVRAELAEGAPADATGDADDEVAEGELVEDQGPYAIDGEEAGQ